MARLYSNENFPLPVVEELRRLGHAVLTPREAGETGKSVPDEQVLAFATAEARALITPNRKHFSTCTMPVPIMPASSSVALITISRGRLKEFTMQSEDYD